MQVRRGRRLVISSICTIANYEYGFYWYFGLDGTIQHEVKLTGERAGGCSGGSLVSTPAAKFS